MILVIYPTFLRTTPFWEAWSFLTRTQARNRSLIHPKNTIKVMEIEHVIDEEALAIIRFAIERRHHWLAYNSIPYFLKKEDIYCFKHREEADEFCMNNISEFDVFVAFEAATAEDAIQRISSGQCIDCSSNRTERNRGDMDDLDMSRGRGHHL